MRGSRLFRGWGDRLTFRLLVLLSMALLPLGAISIHTTAELKRAAQRAGERGLLTLAADAVAGERALVETAIASARAAESLVLERLDDPEDCSDFLRSYVTRSQIYSFMGFIAPDGGMRCVSQGVPVDFATSPVFQALRRAPMTTIAANPSGAATGLPVLIVTRPVYAEQDLAGFLSVSITQGTLQLMAQRAIEDAPRVALLVNHDGAVLSRVADSPDLDLLPSRQSLVELAAQGGSRVFRDTTRDGDAAVYAMAELIPRRLYALAVWNGTDPAVLTLDASFLPLLFPAAMWLACLAVVLLAVHYLVLTHLKGLNRQMRRFALGQREDWPDLPAHAPSELRDLHGTFRNMARLIARDEDERERALAEKTVLLKEIHHRVKNNLQLIASVINLQLRQLADPEARRVLTGVQQRVLGLASVHRSLYGEDRLARVRADRVIEELLNRVAGVGAAPGHGTELRLRMAPLVLDADQMVPLSFLLHEAATNALKYLKPGHGGGVWIAVDLFHETPPPDAPDPGAPQGWVVLRMRNPAPVAGPDMQVGTMEAPGDGPGDGLGGDLIDAFALQLGGTCRQDLRQTSETGQDGYGDSVRGDTVRGDTVWELELRFPAPTDVVDGPGVALDALETRVTSLGR